MLSQKDLVMRLKIQLKSKYTIAQLDEIVRSVVDTVVEAASNGEDVNVPGLGKFFPRYIKGKIIRNTGIEWLKGKEYTVPNRYHLGFSPTDSANRRVGDLIKKTETSLEADRK